MSAHIANDLSFVRSEYERIVTDDDSLALACSKAAMDFLPLHETAAPIVAKKLIEAVNDRVPMSLLRVGDGEGNALGIVENPVHPLIRRAFHRKFATQNGLVLEESEAQKFCARMRDALVAADILGFRSVDRSIVRSERDLISRNIERGNLIAALGMLYARNFLQGTVEEEWISTKTLTSAWVHLGLLRHHDEMLRNAPSVIVISGRQELKACYEDRLGKRLRGFWPVRGKGYRPQSADDTHYGDDFPKIIEALKMDLRGTLVLVGAGLFGKIYCDAAKMSGAVAVDMGSAFDILSGITSRPVHSLIRADLLDMRWVR